MLGEVINNYEIKSLLGEGGMGAVYLAEHPFIGRRAAIKVLRRELAQDATMVERFMNEARAANAIRHPNIIDIIDVGRTPSGIPYLMMEFLEGVSLSQRIAQVGQLDVLEALEIGAQTAGALGAAHAKGIVHRDLKPDNLFLVPDEGGAGGAKVKVLDFGIAKLRGELTNLSARTQAGALMGTPPYMSPEQCRGLTDDIDHRTDVYALGIILYEMMCGAPPFVSQGWGEVVMAHMSEIPTPPRDKNPRIPPAVQAAIQKALAKDRNTRFSTMAELQAVLRAELPGPRISGIGLLDTRLSPPRANDAITTRESAGPTTTFRNAAAEVTPAGGVRAAPRRLALAAVGAGAAALLVVVVAKALRPKVSAPPAEATDDSHQTPTALQPAAAIPAPPPPVEPPAPAQVRLRLNSEPAGATVIDAADGTVLGSTPLDRQVTRGEVPLSLRLSKPGYASTALTVPRDADREATIRLEKTRARPAAVRREPVGAPPTRKVVSAGAGVVSPPRPPAAEPPASAPTPPTRRPEKW